MRFPDSGLAKEKDVTMSIWLVIVIVVLVVFAMGGFGYRRRR